MWSEHIKCVFYELLPQERILLLFIQRYFTNEANLFSTLEATCQSDTFHLLWSVNLLKSLTKGSSVTSATCKKSGGRAGFPPPESRHESSLYSERVWSPNLNQIQSRAVAVKALFLQTHLDVWKCRCSVIVKQEAKMSSDISHLLYIHHCT